jgi:exodeoxyribonuclease VII large subunit
LQAQKTITANGFITRSIINNNESIQILLTVTALIAQTLNKYSEHGIKKIELLQAKAAAGFRDVYNWLKANIINEEPFKIGVTIENSAL